MKQKELSRMQKKIDAIYQKQVEILETGLKHECTDFIQSGYSKAHLVIEIMERLRLHSHSHCLGLRADLVELKENGGSTNEYSKNCRY